MVEYVKILRFAWRAAPWIIAGVLALLLFNRPSTVGGGMNTPGAVVVAGKDALTDKAEDWKEETRDCPPPPGSTAPSIKIVYREMSDAEKERLARQYGATLVAVAPPTGETGPQSPSSTSLAPISGPETQKPSLGLSVVFGEYYGPAAPYGTTFLAGLKPDGEFEGRFDILPPPKFRFLWVYGLGGFADFSSGDGNTLDPTRDNRVYAFLEPFQTKRVYWRLEAGMHEAPDKWATFWGIKAEWRTDPWVPKKWRELKTLLPKTE